MQPTDYVKFCPICNETKQNTLLFYNNEKFQEFTKGFFYLVEPKDKDDTICPCCKQGELTDSVLTFEEFKIIDEVSDSNRQFLEAMIKLKESNIIEYELKMNQFKNQIETKKIAEKMNIANANIPHCPTCGSTDIKKISATTKVTNTIAFGIFGTKRHKTYHCNNCKYEW